MKKRIITAVTAIALFVPVLIFSDRPAFLFPTVLALLSGIAAYEILNCVGLSRFLLPSLVSYATALAMPVLARFVSEHTFFLLSGCLFFLFLFCMLVFATFSRGKIGVTEAALAALMIIYVAFSFSSLVLLRDLGLKEPGSGDLGGKLFLLCFFFAWMPDTGGYFIGKFFGKHKLIPDVSPKKTVEGLFGGLAFALVTAVVYGFVIGLGKTRGKNCLLGFTILCVMAILCALVSVCGDLIASLVKRRYGVKDYGFLFPGHGGVMDRFDSVIAVAPILYMLARLWQELGLFSGFSTLL